MRGLLPVLFVWWILLISGGVLSPAHATPKKPAPAASPAAPVSRATVEAQLNAFDRPLRADEIHELGGGVDRVLVDIAQDERAPHTTRMRAVSALAYTPGPSVQAYLEQVIVDRDKDPTVEKLQLLRKAALSLGWIGGARVPDELAPLLDHADRDVRLDAAVAVALTRQPAAREVLQRRLLVEKDPAVSRHIARQLQTLDPVLRKPAPAGKELRPRVVNPPPGPNDPRLRIGGER